MKIKTLLKRKREKVKHLVISPSLHKEYKEYCEGMRRTMRETTEKIILETINKDSKTLAYLKSKGITTVTDLEPYIT